MFVGRLIVPFYFSSLKLSHSPTNEHNVNSVHHQNANIDIDSIMLFERIFKNEVDDEYFDWNL